MAFLEVNNLNKYYPITDSERFHALKDVQLSFEKGELVSIIGESGSGKSTLMNLLGGLDSQFDGEILVDGENIGQFKEKEMVAYHKEKIGFIFQSFNLVPHLSILDNVTLAMTLSNVDGKTRKARAKEVLEQLGLKDHYHKKPNQLSGGQKQRVAIAGTGQRSGHHHRRRTYRGARFPDIGSSAGHHPGHRENRQTGHHGHPLRARRFPFYPCRDDR